MCNDLAGWFWRGDKTSSQLTNTKSIHSAPFLSFLIQLKLFLIINWHITSKANGTCQAEHDRQMILYTCCTTRPQSSAYRVSFLAKISLVQMIWWSQLQHQLVTCMKFWTDQCTRNTGAPLCAEMQTCIFKKTTCCTFSHVVLLSRACLLNLTCKMSIPEERLVFFFMQWCISARFPESLQVFKSIYKLNLPSKALQVLMFASRSLQV